MPSVFDSWDTPGFVKQEEGESPPAEPEPVVPPADVRSDKPQPDYSAHRPEEQQPREDSLNSSQGSVKLEIDNSDYRPEPERASTFQTGQGSVRRRKSRWGTEKQFLPGLPTILPSDIDEKSRQAYLLIYQIEDLSQGLRSRAYEKIPIERDRSPSPEPVYDSFGKRLNSREVRKKQEMEMERHLKIQELLKINPEYKPPGDYRPKRVRVSEKVWIPSDSYPMINFVGLLIGPRGNTLKALEAELGVKIIICGIGSSREGKVHAGPQLGEGEPLHALVTGSEKEVVAQACERIQKIVEEAIISPPGQSALMRYQKQELALLQGYSREDCFGGMRCSNCGSDQHKTWECMEALNVTMNLVCENCGAAGHLTKDCLAPVGQKAPDEEYNALLEEIGEKKPTSGKGSSFTPLELPQTNYSPFEPTVRRGRRAPAPQMAYMPMAYAPMVYSPMPFVPAAYSPMSFQPYAVPPPPLPPFMEPTAFGSELVPPPPPPTEPEEPKQPDDAQ